MAFAPGQKSRRTLKRERGNAPLKQGRKEGKKKKVGWRSRKVSRGQPERKKKADPSLEEKEEKAE